LDGVLKGEELDKRRVEEAARLDTRLRGEIDVYLHITG
jgi:hypothetical protein